MPCQLSLILYSGLRKSCGKGWCKDIDKTPFVSNVDGQTRANVTKGVNMQSRPWVTEFEFPVEPTQVQAESLYAVLQGVKDQRDKRGQCYEAALVLTLIVLAKLAGEQSLHGIA